MSTNELPPADLSPSVQLMQILWPGAVAVQAIHVAAKLALADHVADGPKTTVELAALTRADEPSLRRFLRALGSLGIFAEDGPGRYQQTALSDTLRSDHPESIRPWAMMLGADFVWNACGDLATTILTGQPAFERIYRAPFFKHLATHPDDAALFNAAMGSVPQAIASVVNAYDFSQFEQIVDVGGGQGALLFGILMANPDLRGVLYDLPAVVAGAVKDDQLADRCEIIGGDIFEGVPPGADAYLLSRVVHDWPDAAALTILNNCRRAVRPDGVLLLIEGVLTPSSQPSHALMDALMMGLTGGHERTESEFRSLLQQAGFSHTRIISSEGTSIIETRAI